MRVIIHYFLCDAEFFGDLSLFPVIGMMRQMTKPWSISTTVRSPDRIRQFLSVLHGLEGENWDNSTQVEFQIRLIQARAYGAGNLQFYGGMPREDVKLIESGKEIPYKRAAKMFHRKEYEDPPMRGRTSFKPLEKFGFASKKDGFVGITSAGNLLLDESHDYGDIFLRSFLKWQFPNPLDRDFPFNIKPFVGVLRLIDAVNKMAEKNGDKPKGLSLSEFGFFALTLIDWRRVEKTAEQIILLRKQISKKPSEERNAYFNWRVQKIHQNFDLKNIPDYTDNAIRYFRMTKYVVMRGEDTHIDLNPLRKYELKALFRDDNAAPNPEFILQQKGKLILQKTGKNDLYAAYSAYLGDANVPDLPGETKRELIAAIRLTESETKKLDKRIKIPPIEDIPVRELKRLRNKRREELVQLSREEQRKNLKKPDEARKLIEELRGLANRRRAGTNDPTRLEYLVSAALDGIWNDAKKIQPNYPTNDLGEPTHTAGGGKADIECFYINFAATCEVTLTRGKNQWMLEAQPVMRHLSDFQKKHKGPSYCLFVAPSIHQDSLNTFKFFSKNGYEGDQQRFVPLTITQFCDVADFCAARILQQRQIRSTNIMELFNLLSDSVMDMKTTPAWESAVPEIIGRWKQAA